MNALQWLADTPVYLKDQQIIKEIGYGNKAKGVNATSAVNNFADRLTREWLIKPVVIDKEVDVIVVTEPTICKENKVTLADIPGFNKNIEFVISAKNPRHLQVLMKFRHKIEKEFVDYLNAKSYRND